MPVQQTNLQHKRSHADAHMVMEPIHRKKARTIVHRDELRMDKIVIDEFCICHVIDDHDYTPLMETQPDFDSENATCNVERATISDMKEFKHTELGNKNHVEISCHEKLEDTKKTNHRDEVSDPFDRSKINLVEYDIQENVEIGWNEEVTNYLGMDEKNEESSSSFNDKDKKYENIARSNSRSEVVLRLDVSRMNLVECSIQDNVEFEFDLGIMNDSEINEKSEKIPSNSNDGDREKLQDTNDITHTNDGHRNEHCIPFDSDRMNLAKYGLQQNAEFKSHGGMVNNVKTDKKNEESDKVSLNPNVSGHESPEIIHKIDQINEMCIPFDKSKMNFVEYSIQENVEIEFDEGLANDLKMDEKHEKSSNSNDDGNRMDSIFGNERFCVNQSLEEHRYSQNSFMANDSGIESLDSILDGNENSYSDDSITMPDEVVLSFETPVSCSHESQKSSESDAPRKTYSNKRKNSALSTDIFEDSMSSSSDLSTAPTKNIYSMRKNRELLLCDESQIIEGDYENSRRVTRQLVKNHVEQPLKLIDVTPGKLVWGYFSLTWWPALIIKAEDAGMLSNPDKVWVYWIGEWRISELARKNVDSFSNNLEERLDHLLSNAKTKVMNKKQKDSSCFQLIQLLKDHFPGGALVKPYTSWLKKNILPHKDELDELVFYPYPKKYSAYLDGLKETNAEQNERYLRQQAKKRSSKTTESKASPRKMEKLEKPIEEGGINIMDQKPGMIVWAKMQGYSSWPCVIMDYQHLNRRQPHFAHQWVMWYGDYKFSQVDYRTITTFPSGMEKMKSKIESMRDELFCSAVLQAFKDYCEPLEYLTESWTLTDVIHIFYNSEGEFKIKRTDLDQPNEEDLYSQTIKKQLRKQINREPENEERKQKIMDCRGMELILTEQVSMEVLCITCFRTENLEEHPFFFASMCSDCLDEFKPKIFAYGNDGKCFYCALCGGEDNIAMCDGIDCPRVFCTACIKYIICPESFEEILLKHPWYCFFCDPNQIVNSILKIRKDWRKRMISIYRVNCEDETRSDLERIDSKRKIRVLSLFDGIGTGLVVLKKLNIEIECYYASEIDPDAIQVSFFNHGDAITQLGDVRNIDEKKIKEIAPIDLLIGGSPCNELSLANPKRRGLDDPEGTGVLFYDYCRIKKLLKKHNKKRHLFWLFENVASMPKKYRLQISEHLGREPQFIDSADFSAQHRPRLYWGNLPGGPYQMISVTLQDMLRKRCNRQALVKKIMTVTTRSNSLSQTKENLKPVLMNGKKDGLWVTELEEIFGFPMHYTDANLQKTRRLQLIGKAWSVQTVAAILRPIFYFQG